jgi:hypothetical protein
LGKGDGLLLLGSSSFESGMMICTLFTDLLTTLSWLQSQLVHTNVDMVICQLDAAQKHSQLQSKSLSKNNNLLWTDLKVHKAYANCSYKDMHN